jgi:hypothetical protein
LPESDHARPRALVRRAETEGRWREHELCKPERASPVLEPASSQGMPMSAMTTSDPHTQLRSLYMSLLQNREQFDEFKRLLALYDVNPEELDAEPVRAASVRQLLNLRIRDWLGGEFEGLSAAQALKWRVIVVEERANVSLSPWKESNFW